MADCAARNVSSSQSVCAGERTHRHVSAIEHHTMRRFPWLFADFCVREASRSPER